MGLFGKFFVSFGGQKKSNISLLPSANEPVVVYKNSIKCSSYPYKTLASFDLTVAKPRYEGEIPEASIKFYPID